MSRSRKRLKGNDPPDVTVSSTLRSEIRDSTTSKKHKARKTIQDAAAMADSYNSRIRPMLDAIEKIRELGVMKEGISLPNIVVVGDQSSGKSSVLEALAGVSLPKGQGIVTRVPLVLRLQSCNNSEAEGITISAQGESRELLPAQIQEAVINFTGKLAGENKGIVNSPISLHVRKRLGLDLTLVDLPGITRVPVGDQPKDIYEKISSMIKEYITPKESIILNVLSATVDFPTCESICMSQEVDREGKRTLAVVTKSDIAPEGLYDKVLANAVNIGLGYICVSNKIDEHESIEEARWKETQLFDYHPSLSVLEKSMWGMEALAGRLTDLQAEHVIESLPKIIEQIQLQLNNRYSELRSLPRGVGNGSEAGLAFYNITHELKVMLEKLMRAGNNEDFPQDTSMHFAARLDDLFSDFKKNLEGVGRDLLSKSMTQQIMSSIHESKGVSLPNFLSQPVFQQLIHEQVVRASPPCMKVLSDACKQMKKVALLVIEKTCSGFPNLAREYRDALSKALAKSHDECHAFIERILQKNGKIIFTQNVLYMETVNVIRSRVFDPSTPSGKGIFGFNRAPDARAMSSDYLQVPDLRGMIVNHEASNDYRAAQEMQINLFAYWTVLSRRLMDEIPLEIRHSFENVMLVDLDEDIVSCLSQDTVKLREVMAEDMMLWQKRKRLEASTKILNESLHIVSKISSNRSNSYLLKFGTMSTT